MADELIYQDEDVKLLNYFQDEAMVDPDSEDQRVLSFFTVKFHYAHPFHVIADEAFYLSYVGIHGPNALDSLSRYLHGEAMFLMTRCCYNNMLEKTESESGAELCPIEVFECGCKEKNVGEECINKVLKSRQFETKKKRRALHIFLATDDETNFLSIEKEYPIIEEKDGILDLSVTLGAMNSFSKFKVDQGVKGAEIVWKEARVGGTKKAAAAGTASKKLLKVSDKKEPAADGKRSRAKAVQGLMADARKTAAAGTAGADARKTAANDVKGKKLLAATATEMAGKQPTADAIKSSKAKRFRNAEKVPDGNEHGGEEPSGKKAAKRCIKSPAELLVNEHGAG